MQYKNATGQKEVYSGKFQSTKALDTSTRIRVLLTCGGRAAKAAGGSKVEILVKERIIFKVTTLVSRLISEVVTEVMEEERDTLLHHSQI